MGHDPTDAFCRAAGVERHEAPSILDELDPAQASGLTDLLQSALERRHDEIARAVDEGLGMVPRPLRGPVRKIVGV